MPDCAVLLEGPLRAEDDRVAKLAVLEIFVAEARRADAGRAVWSSSGFGSKVSTWLGPPCMNSEMTRFAVAGKGGAFGASGFERPAADAVALEQVQGGQPADTQARRLQKLPSRIVSRHR